MEYVASVSTGKESNAFYDALAAKGMAQIAREEKLSLVRLCAKIRNEAETLARQVRRQWIQIPCRRYGFVKNTSSGPILAVPAHELAQYWIDRLSASEKE